MLRDQIRQILKKKPLRETARATGIDPATLSRIRTGQSRPSGEVMERLAHHWRMKLR